MGSIYNVGNVPTTSSHSRVGFVTFVRQGRYGEAVPATIRDVAAAAGVSPKTVTNVLHDYPHVRPQTRQRVQRAIAELDYRPNLIARQLKSGKTGFLALVVPEIEAPYFAELAARLSAAAHGFGFTVLLEPTMGDPGYEQKLLDGALARSVDGVLFSPLKVTADQLEARVDRTPMVLLGERAYPRGYYHVSVDSVAASRAGTEHLLGLGRRRIAVIGLEPVPGTASLRLQGFSEALADHDLAPEPQFLVSVGAYTRIDGKRAMQHLLGLSQRPDAVFCFNDLMAIGALQACREAGVRVPEDVAIAGFDNIAETMFSAPTLTTIAPDLDALVSEALRLLLGQLSGTVDEPRPVRIGWCLEVRQSTTLDAGAGNH